ncbi:MAG: CNNM domain-containing protein [Clostridia bacterium]
MIVEIIILIALILLNGIFSSSELAFLSLDKIKLKQKIKLKDKKAIKIKKLLDNSNSFLATIQIAITFAGFLASAFAAESFADKIAINFKYLPISQPILQSIILILVTLILSYFTLVFGELFPKKIALAYPEKIAYKMVNVIVFVMKIAYPFVWLLTCSTNFLSKIFKVRENMQEKLTEEKIKAIIATGKDEGAIEDGEKDLIFNVFSFNDKMVNEIMTVKENVVSIEISISSRELLNVIKVSKYTRIPVYKENINNIIGILNVKDIIINYQKDKVLNLESMLHIPYFVDEYDIVDDIFRKMQHSKQAMAIVQDRYKHTIGIITIEDAIEEIVGNIFDEYE